MVSLYKRPQGRQHNYGKEKNNNYIFKKWRQHTTLILSLDCALSWCLARGCAHCPCLHSWCCTTLQRASHTSPRVTITATFKQEAELGKAIIDAILQNNVPACGSLHAYACTHSSCLVCVKERKEKQGRAVFVKQTVDSVCVSFLIHLCLHP